MPLLWPCHFLCRNASFCFRFSELGQKDRTHESSRHGMLPFGRILHNFFNLNAGETISLQETIFPGLLSACIFFFQPSGDGCCARIACYKGLRRPTSASSCSYSSRAYGSFTAKGSSAFSGTICSQRVRSLRRVRRVQIAGMF